MALEVWKFPLKSTGHINVSMPVGADIISVQALRGLVTLWATCDQEKDVELRNFFVAMTGAPLPELHPLKSVGTVQLDGGDFVFHVFEVLGGK